jgi:hypothetical protein
MQTANSPRTKALVAAFVVLVASNVSALAWGYEGHRIIAEIAEQFLEPELRTAFAIFLLSKTAPPSRRCQHGPTKFDRSTRNAAVALRKHPDPSQRR